MNLTLTDLFNEDATYPYCPTCQGAGSLTYVGGPGWYSTYLGAYLPTERDEPCDDCHATGRTDNTDSPTNIVRHHFRNLTHSQRHALQRLMTDTTIPITQANHDALEEFFSHVDNELGSNNPIAKELLHILDHAKVITLHPASIHRYRTRIY